MDRELSPEEVQDLLSAYALDAVDDDERAAIDDYLARTPELRDEVAALQAAAAMLGQVGGPPPDGVWERLESLIAESPSPLRLAPSPGVIGPARSSVREHRDHRWQWLAAAAAVVALVFAGLWIVESGSDTTRPRDTAELAREAGRAPGARRALLVDPAGHTLATAVVLRDGTGYLMPELPRLTPGRSYQLWGITGARTISLGVLGANPSVVAFKAASTTAALAITTEVAGGVAISEHAPDAVGDLAVPS
jgi:anti-sigma-K factor RskA